jgi:hypothetical protein
VLAARAAERVLPPLSEQPGPRATVAFSRQLATPVLRLNRLLDVLHSARRRSWDGCSTVRGEAAEACSCRAPILTAANQQCLASPSCKVRKEAGRRAEKTGSARKLDAGQRGRGRGLGGDLPVLQTRALPTFRTFRACGSVCERRATFPVRTTKLVPAAILPSVCWTRRHGTRPSALPTHVSQPCSGRLHDSGIAAGSSSSNQVRRAMCHGLPPVALLTQTPPGPPPGLPPGYPSPRAIVKPLGICPHPRSAGARPAGPISARGPFAHHPGLQRSPGAASVHAECVLGRPQTKQVRRAPPASPKLFSHPPPLPDREHLHRRPSPKSLRASSTPISSQS